jgi:hypothetical protein
MRAYSDAEEEGTKTNSRRVLSVIVVVVVATVIPIVGLAS